MKQTIMLGFTILMGFVFSPLLQGAIYSQDTAETFFDHETWEILTPTDFISESNRMGYAFFKTALFEYKRHNRDSASKAVDKAKNSFLVAINQQPNIVSFNGLAKIALLEGKQDEAKRWLERSFDLDKNNPEALYLKARLLIQAGDNKKATKILQGIVQNHDTYSLAYLALADIAVKQKQFSLAENYFQRLLALDKKIPAYYTNLAWLYKQQRRNDEALAVLLQGYEYFKSDAVKDVELAQALARFYTDIGQPEKALKLAQSVWGRFSGNVEALNLYLDALLINKQSEKAKSLLQGLIEHDNSNVQARIKLITLLSPELENQSRIIRLFKEVIALRKQEPVVYADFNRYLIKVKNYDEARKNIAVVKAVFPDSNFADVLAAELVLAQGDNKRAARFYLDAYQKNKNNNLLVHVVQAFVASQQESKAIALLKNIIESENSIAARVLLAGIYLKGKELSKAEKQYRAVLKQNPNHYIALNDLAWLLNEQHRSKQALPLAEKAYAIAPNNTEVIDTYVTILKQLGMTDKADEVASSLKVSKQTL